MANDVTSKVIFGLDPSQFRRGIQQVDAKLKETSKLFGNLGQAIGAAFAVSQIQAFTAEALRLGGQLETVSRGFARFGNEANLEQLRIATRGLVSDLDLMKAAVTAGNFGIPIQMLGKFLEFAAKRAAETGESVDYMMQSIVKGVSRGSIEVLDNLGISASRLREELNGAAFESQDMGVKVSIAAKIVDEELAKMGSSVDTAADKIARLSASWENFTANFGEAVAPVAGGFLDALSNMLNIGETMGPALNRLGVKTGLGRPSDRVKAVSAAAPMAQPFEFTGPFSPPKLKKLKLFQGELNRLTLSFTSQERVMSGHIIPAYDEFNRMMKGAKEQTEAFDAQLRAASMVGAEFGAILSQAFSASIISGEDFFETLRKALMDYVKQMAVALATTTALAAIFSVVTGGGFGAAFGAISQGTGLGNLFGEGGLFNMNARVSGSDLLLGTQRSGNNFSRSGG